MPFDLRFEWANRGSKHTHWEGGVRVPWIVLWPGHVPAGRTDELSVISGADWVPTLCGITGVQINVDDFDGENTSAAWFGEIREECISKGRGERQQK